MRRAIWIGLVVVSAVGIVACEDETELPVTTPNVDETAAADTGSGFETPVTGAVWRASDVSVVLDSSAYEGGERVSVTLVNRSSAPVYAPVGDSACSVVAVERFEAGSWRPLNSCEEGVSADRTEIAPETYLSGTIVALQQDYDIQEPFATGSAPAGRIDLDVRSLPTAEPYDPNKPPIEVPLGEEPTDAPLGADLVPGQYRIAFTFAFGSPSGAVQTVYSEEFAVTT